MQLPDYSNSSIVSVDLFLKPKPKMNNKKKITTENPSTFNIAYKSCMGISDFFSSFIPSCKFYSVLSGVRDLRLKWVHMHLVIMYFAH